MKEVSLGEGKVLLCRDSKGEYSAVGAKCSHYNAPLKTGVRTHDRKVGVVDLRGKMRRSNTKEMMDACAENRPFQEIECVAPGMERVSVRKLETLKISQEWTVCLSLRFVLPVMT